jgi:hypothetical protein
MISVRARRSDPETSHQAAFEFENKQAKAQRSVATVVELLRRLGHLSDFDLRDAWELAWKGKWSFTLPSKARHWARQAGLVRHDGFTTHEGRKVRLWTLGRDEDFLTPPEVCPCCGQRKRGSQ